QRGEQGLNLADYQEELRRRGESPGTVAETKDILDDKGNVVGRTRTTRKLGPGGDVNLPSPRVKPKGAPTQNIQNIGAAPATVDIQLSDGRRMTIPTDQLQKARAEAAKSNLYLQDIDSGQ